MLKRLENKQRYYSQESFPKSKLQGFTLNLAIIEAKRIDFHFSKIENKFHCSRKNRSVRNQFHLRKFEKLDILLFLTKLYIKSCLDIN